MATLFEPDSQANLRGRQLAAWVYRRAETDFGRMSDIPEEQRALLAAELMVNPLRVQAEQRSTDGVLKLLVDGGDGQGFEAVLLPFEDRVSCCISTQVGCAMGCEFCATGLGGFDRNLSVGEIVGQYLLLQGIINTGPEPHRRISHVVYMGMGEPLHNLEAVLQSLRLFKEEVGLSYRHLTVSTVGIVPQIIRLAAERLPIHLAISLHSPFDEIRGELMPVNKRWPVGELMNACREYFAATRRKLTFEYLLIDKVTDTTEQAKALAQLVQGLPCLVNLIPFNYVDTLRGFKRPSNNRVRLFREILEAGGVRTSQRMERGHDIAAACGQLKGRHEGRFARRPLSKLQLSP
jgi:23S rRNA (adenine2503-C2)-methyltransferase